MLIPLALGTLCCLYALWLMLSPRAKVTTVPLRLLAATVLAIACFATFVILDRTG